MSQQTSIFYLIVLVILSLGVYGYYVRPGLSVLRASHGGYEFRCVGTVEVYYGLWFHVQVDHRDGRSPGLAQTSGLFQATAEQYQDLVRHIGVDGTGSWKCWSDTADHRTVSLIRNLDNFDSVAMHLYFVAIILGLAGFNCLVEVMRSRRLAKSASAA